jgi:hypothetical protein
MGESGEWAEGGAVEPLVQFQVWFDPESGSVPSLVAFWIWAVLLFPKLLADLSSASFRRHPKGCAPLVVPAC